MPHYRDLSAADEQALLDRHMNRVTDTCIPEMEAMRRIEAAVLEEWVAADRAGERYFPHEFMYKILRSGKLKKHYQIDPKDSWMLAAVREEPAHHRARLGGLDPGQHVCRGHQRRREERAHRAHRHRVHDGMLAGWYAKTLRNGEGRSASSRSAAASRATFRSASCRCCTRTWHAGVPLWGYFCQISDSTTSYGSYSGRRAQREDHLGQARRRHAEVHHRERRDDRGAADLCVHPRLVSLSFSRREKVARNAG